LEDKYLPTSGGDLAPQPRQFGIPGEIIFLARLELFDAAFGQLGFHVISYRKRTAVSKSHSM
jgi:hypothetical protein